MPLRICDFRENQQNGRRILVEVVNAILPVFAKQRSVFLDV
jgi:hypothetical protein